MVPMSQRARKTAPTPSTEPLTPLGVVALGILVTITIWGLTLLHPIAGAVGVFLFGGYSAVELIEFVEARREPGP
jgi:hypothetical protein